MDIAACTLNNCLYICDWLLVDCSEDDSRVHKYLLDDKRSTYWNLPHASAGISVTSEGHVIVAFHNQRKVIEYDKDGQVLLVVILSVDIIYPVHAIKLTNGQFVVSHGHSIHPLSRVCIVGTDGRIVLSFGGLPGGSEKQLDYPMHLALDKENGYIIVADTCNYRILILTHCLTYIRILTCLNGELTKLDRPWRMCLIDDRLYATEWDSQHLLIYKAKK